jgi:cephalosporin hydroxylase
MASEPAIRADPTTPPTVSVDIGRATLREYWLARAAQHTHDTYAGVPISKFPEDLRAYEHLLWVDRPDTVVELGVHYGGATLWLRDRMRALASYGRTARARVVGVEIDAGAAREHLSRADPDWERDITLIEADVADPETPERVAAAVEPGSRCLVIEDTAHTYETTIASLRGFSRFVPEHGFFVVEDGTVDQEELRLEPRWPRGVLRAIDEWLATEDGRDFTVRRDFEMYGLSNHPSGFLQRTRQGVGDRPTEKYDPPVQVGIYDLQRMITELREWQERTEQWMERALRAEQVQGEWRELHAEWQARATEAERLQAAWQARATEAERQVGERNEAMDRMAASWSWRVTRPLRSLGERLRPRA